MSNNKALLRRERILWLAATTLAIGILLIRTLFALP